MEKRTLKQNNSLHLYFTLLADELNSSGQDMRKFLKPEVDIPWSPTTIKEFIWKPIQESMLLKKSTTELTTDEVSKVYEVLNRYLGDKRGVHVPFPCVEDENSNS